jgi:hypothetical protein
VRSWILTGSPENLAVTREQGFSVIGLKERNRARAEQLEPGDRIVFYVTGVKAFGGSVRVAGELFEDRARIWPGKPGQADAYPWRFATEPEVVPEEDGWLPAETVAEQLEHVRKWPREHWTLAFQGQLRPVSEADAALLLDRMRPRAGAAA